MNKYLEKIAGFSSEFAKIKPFITPKNTAIATGAALATGAVAKAGYNNLSDDNKKVAKTLGASTAASLPLGAAGAIGGALALKRFGPIAAGVGGFVGSHVLGGVPEALAIKHSMNHGNNNLTKEQQ